MHTVFALLCFVVVIHWLIFPYPSGLLHWHCGNLTIAPVPAKQPWWIWINTSCEFIMNDCITTTKQSTTKPCAYFLGYTVPVTAATSAVVFVHRLLSTLFNKEVFLSFGIFASYIMQWPLSGPWTGINKILIICIGFVCYKLTRPSDHEILFTSRIYEANGYIQYPSDDLESPWFVTDDHNLMYFVLLCLYHEFYEIYSHISSKIPWKALTQSSPIARFMEPTWVGPTWGRQPHVGHVNLAI